MAIDSTQFTGVNAAPPVKVSPQDGGNEQKTFVWQAPATYAAQAINEIFRMGVIPAGSRILPSSNLECAAGAASSTLNIGLRRASDLTVISATQIASGVNLTAAGVKPLNNGAGFAGSGYVCPVDMEVYGTFTGATNTANQAITVYLDVVTGH